MSIQATKRDIRYRSRRWRECLDCKQMFKREIGRMSSICCPPCGDIRRDAQLFALGAIKRAVSAGALPKVSTLTCVDCGSRAACYEHRDYSAPMAVEPVCVRCNSARGPALLGAIEPPAHIFFAQRISCSPSPISDREVICKSQSVSLTETKKMPKRPKIDTGLMLMKRWLEISPEIESWSARGPVWLRLDGAAEPVMWVRPITALEAKRLGASKWAKHNATDYLSKRELDIFIRLANGQSVGEIARAVYLSAKTVSTYRTRIIEKTDLKNNVEIAMYAHRFGLVDWKREAEFTGPLA